MTTRTLAVACPADDWTLLADGAVYQACALQIASLNQVKLAVKDTEPAADSDDWFLIASEGERSAVLDLDLDDQVWARGLQGEAKVRLWRTTR